MKCNLSPSAYSVIVLAIWKEKTLPKGSKQSETAKRPLCAIDEQPHAPFCVRDEAIEVGQELCLKLRHFVRLLVFLPESIVMHLRAGAEVTLRVVEKIVRTEGSKVVVAHLKRPKPGEGQRIE